MKATKISLMRMKILMEMTPAVMMAPAMMMKMLVNLLVMMVIARYSLYLN